MDVTIENKFRYGPNNISLIAIFYYYYYYYIELALLNILIKPLINGRCKNRTE